MRNWLILITLLVVGALFVPAVSAEEYTEAINDFNYGYASSPETSYSTYSGHLAVDRLYFRNIAYCRDMRALQCFATLGDKINVPTVPQSTEVDLKIGTDIIGSGTIGTFRANGKGYVWLEFESWDIGSYTGTQYVTYVPKTTFTKPTTKQYLSQLSQVAWSDVLHGVGYVDSGYDKHATVWANNVYYTEDFKNTYTVRENNGIYSVSLTRIINAKTYPSYLYIKAGDTVINDGLTVDTKDVDVMAVSNPIFVGIKSSSGDTWFNKTYFAADLPGDPTSPTATVTVYVRSSQTNALIADARVVIEAGFNDPADLQEVYNSTLPSGTKTYTLQPNGGGLPNPDYYRVSVTADGYNAEMPYADITLDPGMSMTMVMGMEPTAGAPEDPGDTYIDVYVRDIYANPIADATVKMGAYTLKTNAAGYTLFDVPVNSTYTYTVKKPGYIAVEGSVTVADAARYPVNIVMGIGAIPTNTPTAEPTVPGATPTVPAGEETPGTGFMEESGQAMATFFGVPLAIGKMILGMLIALAIGMATAKQLKGGAQEFGIGMLGGAMLGVVIGLIPTWVIVVLLLTVGLYIGKMYMSGDAGGR